jgi:hypothetical protein
MPDHVSVGELSIEGVVVVFCAVVDIEPIRFWRNELRDLFTGTIVGQNP